jgi:hypothetical protein
MTLIAKCACQSATIEVSGEHVAHAICHCDGCKRRTGSAFGLSAYFRKQDIVSTAGEMALYALHNAARNEDQERYFCKKCGTTLYWYASSYPGFVGIAAGCFPAASLGEPTLSASSSEKLPWVIVPDQCRMTQ